ncbi:uncharacterized protein LOC129575161 isoform X3 [Sitodiplosis mosellana]|uniref:uncharacterized protein LOC129575161 isoform X3 n=1 Tax=Sitodiplosis mosellana TaxID=263140 RepID=UPI002444DA60|nr:uncharacterized protein LOC129575161 isoform X3 [Sitodiplosis mosellana]
MDFLGTSTQDVVELRAGTSIDLTQSQQLAKASRLSVHNSNEVRPEQQQQQQQQQLVTCFVCGSVGKFQLYSIRVRQNPARPSEPYFPFLVSHHEPPHGLHAVSATQSKVQACSMCQELLHEQWLAFERENRPHLQRLYHLKRADGKRYIGADLMVQGDYAAQMLGLPLNAEHMASSEMMHHMHQPPQTNYQNEAKRSNSRDASPSLRQTPTSSTPPTSSYSPFAQHKLKLSGSHYSNNAIPPPASTFKSNHSVSSNPSPSPVYDSNKYSSINNKALKYPAYGQREALQTPPMSHSSAIGSQKTVVVDDEPALDLRNTSTKTSASSSANATLHSKLDPIQNSTVKMLNTSDVGILDLSMPDKNSINEVCYVCGDEYKRGSLLEISTAEPKDARDKIKPYFPIFNESHPRPARSRPKDPRGMIQACTHCCDHLMKQWHQFCLADVPDSKRRYKLRPTLSTGRATFVCYTCGAETPSSNLVLVYCCQNSENEPFFPFIKSIKPYPNASPISPQGMVQICSECNAKHVNSAETMTDKNSESGRSLTFGNGGRFSPSDSKSQANSDSSFVRFKPYESVTTHSISSRDRDLANSRKDSRPNTPLIQPIGENGHGTYACYICKGQFSLGQLEWLSTSAEHMNSHAMHFPCLRGSDNSASRVLACVRCVNHLAKQWDQLDAERIPLEHRRYNIPSPVSAFNSNSPNGSRGFGGTPPSTPSVSSTPASTSIYCFLCGLHSDLTLARLVHASKEGSRPYFPHLLKHKSPLNAEQLRPNDLSALVCTFCYHSLLSQWRKYESTNTVSPSERTYNTHDYCCHLCGVTTYRKRVRALPIREFPSIADRKNDEALLLENGEYSVVCLDCYEHLRTINCRQQAAQYEKIGVPIEKRGYNWVTLPPPPEDSPEVTVARLPSGERSNSNMRQIINKKNSSPKHVSDKRDTGTGTGTGTVRSAQKRPATSPAPVMHVQPGQTTQPSAHHSNMPSSNNGGRGPFASALRSLAKQADVKDDEPVDQRAVSAGTSGSNSANPINLHQRFSGGGGGTNTENRNTENVVVVSDTEQHRKKASSPPPEKMARMGTNVRAHQPEALARSGFQPYRPDERTAAAGGQLFNPAAFAYSEFMDPRFQNSFRSAVGHHPHAAPMYPHFPSYAQLYNTLLPNSSLPGMIPGMMKMVEEEQRLRLLREEELRREQERQKEIQRAKEAQREKERKEREQREREQRERELREKEQREKEKRELLEKEERDRQFAQMYAAEVQRNLFLQGMSQFPGAVSQRSPHSLGLGLGFPPGAVHHSLPPHMQHSFGQFAAMAGFSSLNHNSQIPSAYNLPHTSSPNASVTSVSSLNLSHNRNNTAPSPIAHESASKSRSTAPSPAHSSSNIPSVSAALPKHYVPPHKYQNAKKHNASTSIAPPAHEPYNISSEKHTNSSSNRNSSNHSNSNNSHFNESLPTSADQVFAMRDRAPKLAAASHKDAMADCTYSISIEKVKSNLVTNNETRSEPMKLSVTSDAPQAKFNLEQISPRKFHSSSDNKLKSIHFINDELNNGCQERLNEVKDLSGRYSSYESYQPPVSDTIVMNIDDKEANVNSIQTHSANPKSVESPDNVIALSKEPIVTNTNSTSLEHDSTISNSDKQIIANDKDSKLSKPNTSDMETIVYRSTAPSNARTENELTYLTDNDAVKSTVVPIKSPQTTMQKSHPDEENDCDIEQSPANSQNLNKLTDPAENPNDITKKPSDAFEVEDDGTAAGQNAGHSQQTKS